VRAINTTIRSVAVFHRARRLVLAGATAEILRRGCWLPPTAKPHPPKPHPLRPLGSCQTQMRPRFQQTPHSTYAAKACPHILRTQKAACV
jgi:hypothetical protein